MKTYTILYKREVEQRITIKADNESDAIEKADKEFSMTKNHDYPYDDVSLWSIGSVFVKE